MREDPIFITGVYRTGTTYVSRLLDAHPDLDITYDSVNYFRFVLKKNIGSEKYHEIVAEVCNRLFQRYQKELDLNRIIRQIEGSTAVTHKEIYAAIMEAFFNFSGKRWGEKSLLEWTNIPVFLSMFSGGKVIHLIRDPRDVVASYKYMTIEPGKRYLDAVFTCMHSMNAAKRYMASLPTDRYFVLIYERLIEDLEKTTRQLCDFLQVDYRAEMFDETKYKDLTGGRFDLLTHTSFPRELGGSEKTLMGKWKEKLEDYEVAFVESMLESQMREMGYPLSEKPSSSHVAKFLDLVSGEPLLKERLKIYLDTGDGVESYPSDPTNPGNWGDTGISGKGASVAYGKKSPDKNLVVCRTSHLE